MPVASSSPTNLPPTLPAGVARRSAGRLIVLAIALAALSNVTPACRGCAPALQSLPSLFISVPVFWLGIMLIQVFSFQLGLVPVISPGPVAAR